jgi:hypothetical protein
MLTTFLLAAAVATSGIRGTWSIVVGADNRTQLTVVRDHNNWGQGIQRSEIPLSDAQINASSETPVHFAFNRDAGVIDFNGSFMSGEGVGRFVFTPNTSYASTLRSLGVSSDEPLDDDRLFSLAMHDVSTAFIRDMQNLGYKEDLQSYVRFKIHGVTTDFVRELRSLGYNNLTAEDLVRFRIHGVSPQFIHDMKDLGFDTSAEDLVRFRIHGVSSEYVKSMRDLGVTGLNSESAVRMRIHGVSTDYVRELADLGYKSLASDDLVRMRIHGVSTEFIRQLASAGYHGIPVDKLVQMKIRGMDPSMLSRGNQ